ncbi:hypothetical protein WOSG25_050120 [Weissella oryzae SG25]|uniref:Uncharacterized protein n=1 Tax=Weissella oryzae (strain DSM 25784 / JCM 18191 / LMG 30913 / SG25) TaxID=1329250 RepID=A0A069CSE4_WEIOS|nr:hypothetical protein [Weissella oryzae]GAK30740.1 hypothetical protein WOSG25_050120 [Weissella oryzae SG25]
MLSKNQIKRYLPTTLAIIGLTSVVLTAYIYYVQQAKAEKAVSTYVKKRDLLNKSKQATAKINEKLVVNYQNDYVADLAQPVVTKFFKIARTYSSSATYNSRGEKVKSAGLASENVYTGKLFQTDKQETHENYVDNDDIHVIFKSAKFYAQSYQNNVLAGNVLVKSAISNGSMNNYQPSYSLYHVEFNTADKVITDVQYLYNLRANG